jgi:hypothetical protein
MIVSSHRINIIIGDSEDHQIVCILRPGIGSEVGAWKAPPIVNLIVRFYGTIYGYKNKLI